jgi:hypothetical protein
MSFTYGALKQAIQDYTENDEETFVANLPVFIRNTEEVMLKFIQLTHFRKNAYNNVVLGNPYLDVPRDYLAPFSMTATNVDGEKRFLDFKDVNFLQAFSPDDTDVGFPRYYAVFDRDNFIFSPTPDGNYRVELHYYYRPESLTALDDDQMSWLSENAPMTMLYGALVEAYTFMKGEQDVMSMYMQRFQQGLVGMTQFGNAKEVTDDYRTGMLIRPKQ